MRIHALRATALFLCLLALPARADEEESFGITMMKAAGSSAAGKGGEFLVKLVSSAIFDASCKGRPADVAEQYLCDALGSVSGRTEDRWKQNVEKQLTEINTKLGELDSKQQQIQNELSKGNASMKVNFDTAASRFVAAQDIIRFKNLWNQYRAQFDGVDRDLERESMLAFAKDIAITNKLHTKLGDLNVALTESTMGSQPLLRYPLTMWRISLGEGVPPESVMFDEIADLAEKQFMDFRYQQHKVYVMYLWAATVLESDCALHPAQCTKPPRSPADFQADFQRYTRNQVEAYNAAVDGMVLAFALAYNENPRTLAPSRTAELALLRANLLTQTLLGEGRGWWGRVYTMGNKWDGALEVTCGNRTEVLEPKFRYDVPVDTRFGNSLDWWVSRAGNDVYDEVHFAGQWRVNHYQLPEAGVGPCRVNGALPNKQGRLPWKQEQTEVVNVTTTDGRTFPFGSFIGVQRAGGTYALASGTWRRHSEPHRREEGPGQRTNVRYDWTLDVNRKGGAPWVALINEGDGEYKVTSLTNNSSRIHNRHQMYLYADKKIYFPDGGRVTLNLLPHSDCAGVCRGEVAAAAVMDYDVWNNDTESKKGSMKSTVAVFFHPEVSSPASLHDDLAGRARGNGIFIDGSYGATGDQQVKRVWGNQAGTFTPRPGIGYHLQYLIDFDVQTEGRFSNKTHWWYRGKLTPTWLYVSQ